MTHGQYMPALMTISRTIRLRHAFEVAQLGPRNSVHRSHPRSISQNDPNYEFLISTFICLTTSGGGWILTGATSLLQATRSVEALSLTVCLCS